MDSAFKRSLIASLLLTTLYGCGGSGSDSTSTGSTGSNSGGSSTDSSSSNGSSSDSSNNSSTDTTTKNSYSYLVCIDSNLDGQCSSDETSKSISSTSAYGVEGVDLGTNSGNYPMLLTSTAQSRSSDSVALVLTAPAGSTSINGATTYQLNEQLFNPDASSSEISFSTAEQEAFTKAIASAIQQYPDTNRYQLIAALSNKITADRSLLTGDLSLSNDEISSADSSTKLARKITSALNSKQSISWELFQEDAEEATDQRVNGIVISGNRALITSQWHNGLTMVEFGNDSSKLLAHTPFAGYAQSGHHTDSYSGASEVAIKEALTTGSDDNAQLFVLVSKGSKSRPDDDESYGIFTMTSSLLQQGGDLWPYGQGLSPDGITPPDGVTRFATDGNYTDMVMANDKQSILAYDASALQIKRFALDGTQSEQTIDLSSEKYLTMAVTSSGQLVVSLDAVTGSHGAQIRIYNLSDLSATPTTVDLEFTADQIYAANNELILVDVSGTKVGRYQLSSGTLTTKDTGVTISRSAISPDGTLLAINSSAKVLLLPLGDSFLQDCDATLTLSANARAIALLDNKRLLVSLSGQLGLSVYDLQSQPVTAKAMLGNALTYLKENAATLLNHGLPLNAGFYDLSLQSNYAPYSSVSLSWSSDSANLSTASGALGTITRGSEDVIANLSATASQTFRGQQIQQSISLPVTLRAQPETIEGETPLILNGDHLTRSFDYLLSSSDGQQLLALGSKGWCLFNTQSSQPQFVIGADGTGTTTQTLLSLDSVAYLNSSIVGAALNGDGEALIAVDNSYDETGTATGKGKLLRVAIDSSATANNQADLTSALSVDGTVTGMAQSQDGSHIVLAMSKTLSDGSVSYWASIRSVSDLSQEQTVLLDQSYTYMALSDDGKRLYGYGSSSEVNATTGLTETVRRIKLFLPDAPKVDAAGLPVANASQTVEANNYRMAYYDGTLYSADYNGNLNLFGTNLDTKVSISYPEDATLASYVTGYGSYNGTDTSSNRGRSYSIAIRERDNKRYAYLWHNQRGLDVLDVTEPAKTHTVQWLPMSTTYRGAISSDGTRAFIAGYSAKSSNSLMSINLDN